MALPVAIPGQGGSRSSWPASMHPSGGGTTQPRRQSRGASRCGGLPSRPAIRWAGAIAGVLRQSKVRNEREECGYTKYLYSLRFAKSDQCIESVRCALEKVAASCSPCFLLFFLDARRWPSGKISSRTPISAGRRWKLFCWGHSRTGERVGELRERVTNTSKRAGDDICVFFLQQRDFRLAVHQLSFFSRWHEHVLGRYHSRDSSSSTSAAHRGSAAISPARSLASKPGSTSEELTDTEVCGFGDKVAL